MREYRRIRVSENPYSRIFYVVYLQVYNKHLTNAIYPMPLRKFPPKNMLASFNENVRSLRKTI